MREPDLIRPPGAATAPETLEFLQRAAGNRAVQRALAGARAAVPGPVVSRETTRTAISETTDTGNTYTQDLLLDRTHNTVEISLGINWVRKGTWASDAAYAAFIRRVKTAAYSYLDNKFKVVCTPDSPAAGPAPVNLPITFILYDDPSGYAIDVHGGTPGGGSAMATTGGTIYEFLGDGTPEVDITYAHEFGHAALGASDEYVNPAMPNRVLTNDHSIMANYYSQGIPQAQFKARHFQHIVTEVAKAFAGYTCSLRSM
ncbi:hypothetical protein [Occultella gossypii]|uniref:Uncharacterized protein n=1 Tax=Occultella gossypii TaxID=2800820 RepID=A0ABS7S7N0_9MICO|nr:hypothetical protein [Occultella gossypii]MBZ2196368.1 hypothetical protein [Occultella gossypii]